MAVGLLFYAENGKFTKKETHTSNDWFWGTQTYTNTVEDKDLKNMVLGAGIVLLVPAGLLLRKTISSAINSAQTSIQKSGAQTGTASIADDLLKLKNLLEQGAITQ